MILSGLICIIRIRLKQVNKTPTVVAVIKIEASSLAVSEVDSTNETAFFIISGC